MLNCYTPRTAPAHDADHATPTKASDTGGRDENGKTSTAKPPEAAITSRRDGRGPYDMRQVVLNWRQHPNLATKDTDTR